MTLAEIEQQICQCNKCILSATKTNYVPGKGNPNADIMFIGEAPDKNEDLQGIPFVGAAGQNLDRLLNLIGLTLNDVYIANILKCRPPDNRDPLPEEITICTPFLNAQIEAIKPKVIVTLGKFATQYMLGTNTGITMLHGKPFVKPGAPAIYPMYHPAAALYNPGLQQTIETDFLNLSAFLATYTP